MKQLTLNRRTSGIPTPLRNRSVQNRITIEKLNSITQPDRDEIMREFEDRLDRNANKIIANQNKGFETVVGSIAVFQSDQKIANRHVQSSVEELRQSARKAERSARKADRTMDLVLRHLVLEQEEKGEGFETQKGVPRNVMASNVTGASSIHDISDCSQSQSRAGLVSINPPSMLEDDDDDTAPSAEIESMRKSHSANPNEAYLQQQNAELLQKLAAEMQKNASVMAEKRQVENYNVMKGMDHLINIGYINC
eukprot:scaffold16111_cov152-Skeletonema_dohrnii-CCMP3373.AAC.6